MGRKFKDKSVQEDIKHFPFTVVEKDGKPAIKITTNRSTKIFTPEEISAMILSKMRSIAVSVFVYRKSIFSIV
jgi:heat shock protein 5